MSRRNWNRIFGKSVQSKISPEEISTFVGQATEKTLASVTVPSKVNVVKSDRAPVVIYENGVWQTVEKSSRDFPYPVKMKMTPELAQEILSERNLNNRSIRNDRVDKYIKDIVNGNWSVINNGIGFYANGSLADGQHRLLAIAMAMIPVDVIVVFGMEKESITAIDEGASRTTKDVANMMGISTTNQKLAATNYILEYKDQKRRTPRNEQISFMQRHMQAVDFVTSKLSRKGITKAPVLAACIRAWYSVDHEILARFLDILDSGTYNGDTELSAIVLREWLLKNSSNAHGTFRMEIYRKTEASIVNFANGTPVTRLYGMNEEQFPLPEELV